MTTESDGLRQSDRVRFRMPVEASWVSPAGHAVKQNAETLLVSRNGGVLRLTEKLSTGQELHLRRTLDGDHTKSTRARVVAEIDQDPPNHFLYAVHILDPRSEFWDIDFPAPHKGDEALARLLMECSFCQRREVVYLNEIQLKSFEVRKCVARVRPLRRRARHSPPQPHAHQSPRPRLHPPPRLSGRNRRMRRSLQRRPQLPQPQSISRRHARRSRRPLHSRHRRHLRPHPHRLLADHPHRRPLPPRRRLHQAPSRRLISTPILILQNLLVLNFP